MMRFVVIHESLPHGIQGLPHGEVETAIHRALRLPMPGAPYPPRPSAIFALAPFVDTVLSEQYGHARKQPRYLLFEFRWRD